MILQVRDLDAFVAESDRLGGPGSPECETYWQDFAYTPGVTVDQDLDPFSDAYVYQQVSLYREISGREFDQFENEQAALNPDLLMDVANPYDHPSPSGLSLHVERLSKALRHSAPRRGGFVLDMGCGWGLSSEVAAYAGLNVIAVDINPQFVALVNGRAERRGHAISATVGTFDDYVPPRKVDLILFYECLHHALRPWTVLERLVQSLESDGRIALAGEPVNDVWWRNWGLRLDALSIYCIRKFGWFESGWSLDFMRRVFARCGLSLQAIQDADPSVGYTLVGRTVGTESQRAADWMVAAVTGGITIEGKYGILSDRAQMEIVMPAGASRASLRFTNFRSSPLELNVTAGAETVFAGKAAPGDIVIQVHRQDHVTRVAIEAQTWIPDHELGNGDNRSLSLHFSEIVFD